jgi:hypothetical protein
VSALPTPVPLDQPPGSPDAVADAAAAARAAADRLDELAHALGAARLPTWRGGDAVAVAERCATTARLAADAGEALHRASARLTEHAELWTAVRVRIEALRARQQDEFSRVRFHAELGFDPQDVLARTVDQAIAGLVAADAARATEHGRLVAQVDEDAAASRRVLAGCCAVVGGSGRHGPVGAIAHLADLLPGWGLPQLARRGRALAWSLIGHRRRPAVGPGDVDALVEAELPFAGEPAYAAAFLAALGSEGTAHLLAAGWNGSWVTTRSHDLFGRVFSGLDRDTTGPSWLATLLDDAEVGGTLPGVAGGLAAALASARREGRAGPPPALAAAWAGTLLRLEREDGLRVDTGVRPAGADPLTTDPLALLLDPLVRQRATVETAQLMGDVDAWVVVLGRMWDDGDVLLDGLVSTVADASGDAARPALRSALLGIGAGLEDADPADWPVDMDVVSGVAPALAAALARHVDVVRSGLTAAATGVADPDTVTALRGLSVVVALDEQAAWTLHAAVSAPVPPRPGGDTARAAATAALVAVREHGARLLHAVDQYMRKYAAEGRAVVWDWTFGLSFSILALAPVAGRVSGALEAVVTDALGTDGQFGASPDIGPRFTAADAVFSAVTDEVGGRDRQVIAEVVVRAFAGTATVLGEPVPPVPTEVPALRDVAEALVGDVVGGAVARRLEHRPLLGEAVGGIAGGRAEDWVSGD